MELKYCPACQQKKPLVEFGIVHTSKDGHRYCCRLCHNRKRREYRLNNLGYQRELDRKYHKRYGLTPRGRFNTLKSNCLANDMPITITSDNFVVWYEAQPQTCYYCGEWLINGGARSGPSSLTIDRKDNQLGYTLDNIVLCCRRCNLIKGAWLTEQQMLEIAERYFKR